MQLGHLAEKQEMEVLKSLDKMVGVRLFLGLGVVCVISC